MILCTRSRSKSTYRISQRVLRRDGVFFVEPADELVVFLFDNELDDTVDIEVGLKDDSFLPN
jgi:hypothetical protein